MALLCKNTPALLELLRLQKERLSSSNDPICVSTVDCSLAIPFLQGHPVAGSKAASQLEEGQAGHCHHSGATFSQSPRTALTSEHRVDSNLSIFKGSNDLRRLLALRPERAGLRHKCDAAVE